MMEGVATGGTGGGGLSDKQGGGSGGVTGPKEGGRSLQIGPLPRTLVEEMLRAV